MKAKYIAVGMGGILVVAAIWLGRVAWRAQHNLVTLHVRNAPLSEVVRSIERQTRERLRLDQKLDAKVTLDVKNMPLAEVLDQVAEQAGARWGKTYAVFGSDNALRRLESVLRGNSELEAAGWTNLAPRFGESDLLPGEPGQVITASADGLGSTGARQFQNEEEFRDFVQKAKDGASVTTNSDGSMVTVTKATDGGGGIRVIRRSPGGPVLTKGNGDAGPGHPMRQVMVRKVAGSGGMTTTTTDGDGRVHITRTAADGKVLKEDQWSPERLVLDSSLSSRLREPIPTKATPETAARTAKTVRGKVATYYALEKPVIPVDLSMGRLISRHRSPGTDHSPDIEQRIEQAKQGRLEEMAKSPEQQVQRARQKQGAQSPN